MTESVFIQPLPEGIAVGDSVQLTGAEARHSQVKRIADGEAVIVSDGAATAVRGAFSAAGVQVTELLELPQPTPRVTIVQALPKSDRSELAVDLMVQAGADRIIPWAASRCIARWDKKEDKALARWEKTAFAATKQSRRLVLPEITGLLRNLTDLPELVPGLAGPQPTARLGMLHEDACSDFRSFVESAAGVEDIVLVIGPEGGIAPDELATLEELGGHAVVLGPEVLRTATAGAVALGAIGALTDRWGAVG
ncbi:16S rRNA (uracil(1498)-N(3))-methyltransferase [uncultured Corynebacterium sp.]|uniref:16S rRNA (uracil(1498)-N(3))-methyltransferase n=1 Tax=uncultured Corynebacterium sp. TaxID=159447 RepID=UPI0028895EDF|nr:16S rRNA (uracil(1498)-N(3))-methyltransferase [uncultured Corynebacterium sp.]